MNISIGPKLAEQKQIRSPKKDSKDSEKKTIKNNVKLPPVNKKSIIEKTNFDSNTVFSLCFKIRAKKILRRKPTRFFALLLVRYDRNSQFNLLQKSCKHVEIS